MLPSWGALTSTTYGRVLLIKLGIVVLVSTLALAARRGLRRPISTHTWGGLRFAQLERASLVVVVVLGLSGLLTAVSPAPATRGSSFPPPIDGPAIYLGTLTGQVSTGLIASDGQILLRLHVPESTTADVQSYRVRGRAQFANGQELPLTLKPCGTGCFAAPIDWAKGTSTISLSLQATGWNGGNLTFVVPWPPSDGHRAFERMLVAMAKQPKVLLTENVTSNTRRREGMSSRLRLSGSELLKEQLYRSGIVSGVVVLGQTGGRTETISTPNHLLTRTYAYPAAR